MEKLFQGIVQFKKEDFENHRELFCSLGRQQQPHTLFVGCSDSRVVPNMITRCHPGELFVIRNVANLIPPYRVTEEYVATTSAIEYAVQALKVERIVVCGHSNCGGCAALHTPAEELNHLPHVRKWLEISREVPERVRRRLAEAGVEDSPAAREWLTEQINITVQMRNLLTYPYIQEKVQRGELGIFGWHYIIETGEVFNYNSDKSLFELIE
jgi:carbonic anhydrase